MTRLQPLLSRDRYSDEEWEYASAGLCDWETAADYHRHERCGEPSDPGSFYRYCAEHDRRARDESPNYGH